MNIGYPTDSLHWFLTWLADGCPDVVEVEVGYTPTIIPADDGWLAGFVECHDAMPMKACKQLAGHVGYLATDPREMTYATAAIALLMKRARGADAAADFLEVVFGATVE